jgi:uncharacterized membrane protein
VTGEKAAIALSTGSSSTPSAMTFSFVVPFLCGLIRAHGAVPPAVSGALLR